MHSLMDETTPSYQPLVHLSTFSAGPTSYKLYVRVIRTYSLLAGHPNPSSEPRRTASSTNPDQEHRADRRKNHSCALAVGPQNPLSRPASLGHFRRPAAAPAQDPTRPAIVQPGPSWRFSHRARTSRSAASISLRSSTGISVSRRIHLARFRPTRSRSR